MKNSSKFILIPIISLTFILFLSFTAYSLIKEISKPDLPILGRISDFSLIDTSGEIFRLNNLKDKIWIANFFFTTCSDICPVMSKNMAQLTRSFELVDDVSFISFTVNPEYDSPEILAQYAKKYAANPNKWSFLTGERETIKQVAVNSFKLGSIEDPVFHSASFSLVDKNGLIRGYYDGTKKEEVNKLFKDAATLIKEL